LVARFDQLRHPAPERQNTPEKSILLPEREEGRDVTLRVQVANRPPEMSVHLRKSLLRLSHTLASETIRGRKERGFARRAHYELNLALSAQELRSFNADLRSAFPKDTILNHGSHTPNGDAPVLCGLPDVWQQFARENWAQVFAAQWAETQATLQPLIERSRPWDVERASAFTDGTNRSPSKLLNITRDHSADQTTDKVRSNMSPEKPLIDAVPDLPPLQDHELRVRAAEHIDARPTLAMANDAAFRIYVEPKKAVARMVAQYIEQGDTSALVSEIERSPESFGDVQGKTRLGIANGDRRSALELTPKMAHKIDEHFTILEEVKHDIVAVHQVRQVAMRKPIPDLSPEASAYMERMTQVHKMPSGSEKEDRTRLLVADTALVQEVIRFRQGLTERYGKGDEAIRKGIDRDPALKLRSVLERKLIQDRAEVVAHAIPVIGQMREQIQRLDRSPDRGKDQSRGIER